MTELADFPPLILLLAGVFSGFLLASVYVLWWKARYSRLIRQDAVQRSQATIAGQVHEQLLPYLPGFEFSPKDARFLGSPVDLVVFDGLDAGPAPAHRFHRGQDRRRHPDDPGAPGPRCHQGGPGILAGSPVKIDDHPMVRLPSPVSRLPPYYLPPMSNITIQKKSEDAASRSMQVTVPVERVKQAEDKAVAMYAKPGPSPGVPPGQGPRRHRPEAFDQAIKQTILEEVIRESWEDGPDRAVPQAHFGPFGPEPQVRGGRSGRVRAGGRGPARDRAGADRRLQLHPHGPARSLTPASPSSWTGCVSGRPPGSRSRVSKPSPGTHGAHRRGARSSMAWRASPMRTTSCSGRTRRCPTSRRRS